MKLSILAYSTENAVDPADESAGEDGDHDDQRPRHLHPDDEAHGDDVHEADRVGDRQIVVAAGDHQHLGHGEQRHGGVVAEDRPHRLDAGESAGQQERRRAIASRMPKISRPCVDKM